MSIRGIRPLPTRLWCGPVVNAASTNASADAGAVSSQRWSGRSIVIGFGAESRSPGETQENAKNDHKYDPSGLGLRSAVPESQGYRRRIQNREAPDTLNANDVASLNTKERKRQARCEEQSCGRDEAEDQCDLKRGRARRGVLRGVTEQVPADPNR